MLEQLLIIAGVPEVYAAFLEFNRDSEEPMNYFEFCREILVAI
jgi:hypothetical protein